MSKSNGYAKGMVRCFAVAVAVFAAAPSARAEESQRRTIGVGYKVGNGIGFTGGDLIVRAFPRVVFDLQANYASYEGFTGFGVAPTVQVQWKPIGHTPYVSVGVVHARLSNEAGAGYTTGYVANAGYEWRFACGIGVLLGAGVQDHGPVHVTRGIASRENGGWSGPRVNLEGGLRYFF